MRGQNLAALVLAGVWTAQQRALPWGAVRQTGEHGALGTFPEQKTGERASLGPWRLRQTGERGLMWHFLLPQTGDEGAFSCFLLPQIVERPALGRFSERKTAERTRFTGLLLPKSAERGLLAWWRGTFLPGAGKLLPVLGGRARWVGRGVPTAPQRGACGPRQARHPHHAATD